MICTVSNKSPYILAGPIGVPVTFLIKVKTVAAANSNLFVSLARIRETLLLL